MALAGSHSGSGAESAVPTGSELARLEADGYVLLRGRELALPAPGPDELRPLRDVLGGEAACPYRALACSSELRAVASGVLGAAAHVVRATLFVKSPVARWSVPWHQDRVVCVRERADVPGFSGWTSKAGMDRALAPLAVSSRMITLRVHLDPCPGDAGPLEVLPGTHRDVHASGARERIARGVAGVYLPAQRGDVIAMRPLLLHRSASPQADRHRRILHVELTATQLPAPLRWRYWSDDPRPAAGAR